MNGTYNNSDFLFEYDFVEIPTKNYIPQKVIWISLAVLGMPMYSALLVQQIIILKQNRWRAFSVAFLTLSLGSIGEICFNVIPVIFHYFQQSWIGGIATCKLAVGIGTTARFLRCYSITSLLLASTLTVRQNKKEYVFRKVFIVTVVAVVISIVFALPLVIAAEVYTSYYEDQAICVYGHFSGLLFIFFGEFILGRCLPYLLNLILSIFSLKAMCQKKVTKTATELDEFDPASENDNIELVSRDDAEYNPAVWILVIALVDFLSTFPLYLVMHMAVFYYLSSVWLESMLLFGAIIIAVLSIITTAKG